MPQSEDSRKKQRREYMQLWRQQHPEKRNLTEQQKASHREAQLRYRRKHPERVRESIARHLEKNRDGILQKHREYLKRQWREHPEKMREQSRRNYLAHHDQWREQRRKYDKAYARANRSKRQVKWHRYYARKWKAEGGFEIGDVLSLFEKQGGKCAMCQRPFPLKKDGFYKFDIDHIIPLSVGGVNYPENIQLLCHPCNASKGNRVSPGVKSRHQSAR